MRFTVTCRRNQARDTWISDERHRFGKIGADGEIARHWQTLSPNARCPQTGGDENR